MRALEDFVRKQKEGQESPRRKHAPKRNEIKEDRNDLRLRRKSISHLKATCDFDDAEFYGFRDDPEESKCWGGELEI